MTVPTSLLRVDPSIAPRSPHGFSDEELRRIASTVPLVYDKMGQGWREADFQRARQSSDPQQRMVGQTYQTLWREPAVSQSLHAHPNQQMLEVDAGNHRIRAAREVGTPAVPVHVTADNAEQLNLTESACEERLRIEGQSHLSATQRQFEADRELSAGITAANDWVRQEGTIWSREEELSRERDR
jgi:hypothetical protein